MDKKNSMITEIVMMLLPDYAKGHIEVISKEMKEMLKEMILQIISDHQECANEDTKQENKGKVKKVDIG